MTEEIWRPLPVSWLAKAYQVSNFGNVRQAPFILATRNNQGYRQVTLRYRGAFATFRVHRLVAAAFIRPPKAGEVVNHLNANRADNRVENLEWTTVQGNARYTVRGGRHPIGLKHHLGKIDWHKAFQMYDDGASFAEIGKIFGATRQAAKQMIERARASGTYKFKRAASKRTVWQHVVHRPE